MHRKTKKYLYYTYYNRFNPSKPYLYKKVYGKPKWYVLTRQYIGYLWTRTYAVEYGFIIRKRVRRISEQKAKQIEKCRISSLG